MNSEISIKKYIDDSEKILWYGKPDVRCVVFECIFNDLLVWSLLWSIMAYLFYRHGVWNGVYSDAEFTSHSTYLIAKAAIVIWSFAPIVMYLWKVVYNVLKSRFVSYVITDRAIYLGYGILDLNCARKSFAELPSSINVHRGIIDRLFGVGDIIITGANDMFARRRRSFGYDMKNTINTFDLVNINDCDKVFQLIKKLQIDVYSDIMYPNDLRPNSNPGYRTQHNVTLD